MRYSFTDFVEGSDAARLAVRLRVAWAAAVYEQVLALYSPYFRKRFLQEDALEMAWGYAVEGVVLPLERVALLERMEAMISTAEVEDYGKNAMFPGMLLLTDIGIDQPEDSVAAVGNAAVMFAAHCLYRQRVGSFDPALPHEYKAELSMPVYRLARAAYEEAQRAPDRPIERGMFSHLHLEVPTQLLAKACSPRIRSQPPPHETEFIRQQGWA